MEQWEKELREKLDKEFGDGMYRIGIPPMVAITGKQGKINFEVEMFKITFHPHEIIGSPKIPFSGIQNQIDKAEKEKFEFKESIGTELTEQTIIDFMNEIRNKCKP